MSNDDDEEKLRLLLDILDDDFLKSKNPLRLGHRERQHQQMVFAKRLVNLIEGKLKVFEDYVL